MTKLQAKIKLERFEENNKKHSCTLGLHGPWGETSSVFMRVTFSFPREYPYGIHPQGTPTVDLEKNPLISIRDRAYILKSLRWIRERKRPCLEACLRFLLFGSDDRALDDDSSDDETDQQEREITMSLLRNNKNLAEPRTSQGAFGPNGSCETIACLMSWLIGSQVNWFASSVPHLGSTVLHLGGHIAKAMMQRMGPQHRHNNRRNHHNPRRTVTSSPLLLSQMQYAVWV